MSTLLVIGETGQLAQELAHVRRPGLKVVTAGRRTFDLDAADPEPLLGAHRPVAVINAAAYTAVDKAESEGDAAYALNRDGPDRLARACAGRRTPLVHISTDYVFDGAKGAPYTETDEVNPLSLYGRSKLEGEQAVAAAGGSHAVLRTTWVFGARGNTFVQMMLNLARQREALGIVSDQFARPTWAKELAELSVLTALRLADGDEDAAGVFHVAGFEDASRATQAESIFRASAARGGPTAVVNHIGTADYPAAAARPPDSRLDSSKAASRLGWAPTPLDEALDRVVGEVLASAA
jgi:dTDP-4-dehydrorhamnose reductase